MSARKAHPDAFAAAEPLLVEAATRLGVADLRRAIARWRDVVDRRQIESDEQARFERRRLHVSPTFDGMGRVDGDLDPDTTETLVTVLRAVMDAEVRTSRTDGRRRNVASTRSVRSAGSGSVSASVRPWRASART